MRSADDRGFDLGARKKPTVLFVLPGIGAGGSEHVVNNVANHLASLGWHVVVAAFAEAETESFYSYRPEVTLRRLGLPPARTHLLAGARETAKRVAALRRAIRDERPSLVISFLTRTNVLALLAGVGLSVPIIVSERNNPAMQPIGAPWSLLRRLLYPAAAGLVTMTEGARNYFPARVRARTWVIPNPVDRPTCFEPRREGRTLAAVGRLVPQKGFDLLLEAFAAVAPKHPEWKLLIWGEGPERAALEAQRDRLGLAGRVLMPGVSSAPGSWVGSADLFVLSSRYEGWGIVLLEAMAAGLPVVSFDCQWGPREMINDGLDGLIVPREDCPALASTLDRLMADAALRERIGAAAALSSRRFEPASILAQWEGVAREVVGRKERSRVAAPPALRSRSI
jgi:glycosyltransferase involved in cell wall biosynthesis